MTHTNTQNFEMTLNVRLKNSEQVGKCLMPQKWTGPTRILGTKMCLPPNDCKIDDTITAQTGNCRKIMCISGLQCKEAGNGKWTRAWWLSCQSYGTM